MLYMFLAEGFEETEAIGSLDVIKRAGIDIKTVGVESKTVTGSHGITVVADITKDEATKEGLTGVILPGGMPGTLNLQKSDFVEGMIDYCAENSLLLAAICAAPMVLGEKNLLAGKNATCYPGFENHFCGGIYTDDYVTVCDNIITGKGAGASMMFGAAIVDYFKKGEGKRLLSEMQHIILD